MKWLGIGVVLFLAGCTGVPEGLHPVTGFDVEKYLGHWNEIARLDHSFERGLTDVTADYRKLSDGRIEVINRGFDAKNNKWNEAKGVARFQGKPDVASLKVSFVWPIYGACNELVLDPQLDQATLANLVGRARALGFATDALIYVEQNNILNNG